MAATAASNGRFRHLALLYHGRGEYLAALCAFIQARRAAAGIVDIHPGLRAGRDPDLPMFRPGRWGMLGPRPRTPDRGIARPDPARPRPLLMKRRALGSSAVPAVAVCFHARPPALARPGGAWELR